jgi:hypothetical protein
VTGGRRGTPCAEREVGRAVATPGTPGRPGPRDPTGTLRATLEAEGAFDDGIFGLDEEQTLLYETLKAQGNPVTLDLMPDSSHESLGDAGWPIFLDAFRKATSGA